MAGSEKARVRRPGYAFGPIYSPKTGQARLAQWPSKKSIKRMAGNVHALTDRAGIWQETAELVDKLNRALRGCASYFNVGSSAADRRSAFRVANQERDNDFLEDDRIRPHLRLPSEMAASGVDPGLFRNIAG
jgi:hypothetical protein